MGGQWRSGVSFSDAQPPRLDRDQRRRRHWPLSPVGWSGNSNTCGQESGHARTRPRGGGHAVGVHAVHSHLPSWPTALAGRFYRNGPVLYERNGERYHHWFDGDGMVQQFTLAAGRITHRGRLVRTAKLESEARAGRFLMHAFGTAIEGGPPGTGRRAGQFQHRQHQRPGTRRPCSGDVRSSVGWSGNSNTLCAGVWSCQNCRRECGNAVGVHSVHCNLPSFEAKSPEE